jgi:glyoxylase-like metal-dependent hydrolase (beta-lactamase superfamily II)
VDIRTFTGAGFGENAYLAVCQATGACVAIDPGRGAGDLVRAIEADGLSLEAILLTHAHLDHIEGVATVRAFAPDVPIWLHPDDLGMYRGVQQQAAMFGLRVDPQPEPTNELVPGEPFHFGECRFDVAFTPGHAPGHVIFVAAEHGVCVVGDVVFQASIGRTDLPGGDFQTLLKSIRTEVLTLPDDMVLLPGHGPATTVGHERVGNPFLVPHYGGELA